MFYFQLSMQRHTLTLVKELSTLNCQLSTNSHQLLRQDALQLLCRQAQLELAADSH